MTNFLIRLTAWFHAAVVDVRARAVEEPDRGEIVEKVIIVAAAAAIAIAAMLAISIAVDAKIGGLQL